MTYPIIDAHCDTLTELQEGETLAENSLRVSLNTLKRHSGFVQFFAVWLPDYSKKPLSEALFFVDKFYEEIKGAKETALILNAEDFEEALSQGKVSLMLTVENGNCLEGSLANLRILHRLGVRGLTLTWNGDNELGSGVEGADSGLTDFGREVVREMNRLGMIVDVSHLSERGFWDVMSVSEAPVMASHSNAYAICAHKRNLTDNQIRAISEQGGVIGLNFYPHFLSNRGEANLWDCLRHIEHFLKIGGENCLGIGSDFDGFSSPVTKGIAEPADFGGFFDFLENQGMGKELLNKVSHGNTKNYVKKVLS